MLHNVSNGWFGEAATLNLASRPKAGHGHLRQMSMFGSEAQTDASGLQRPALCKDP
jgi:hypothetical protein